MVRNVKGYSAEVKSEACMAPFDNKTPGGFSPYYCWGPKGHKGEHYFVSHDAFTYHGPLSNDR